MGRPINKRYLGEPTPGGNEIKVQFYNGSASVDGWIVKQLGSRRFRCTDGVEVQDCVLVDKAAATLIAGEMSISVKDDAGVVKQVVKIAGRKVTTDTGESIKWNFSDSAVDGAVELEEAGGVAAIINVVDAVDGVEYEIIVPGDTVFTSFGAGDSLGGTIFTMANAPGTGTGTVQATSAPADTFGT